MFPIVAVVTHCHKLSSLNKTNLLFLSSGGQKSKNGLYWAQIKVPAAMHFFSGGCRRKSAFSPFPSSRSCPHFLAHGPLLHL